tara:strand:+ start:1524 stop:2336 length:813 start_codon:yes stop_codon:yes gene_type:complete
MANFVPDYLAKKNAHERDAFITFDEGPHIYTVHGDSSFTSVTTWNHGHFPHFDEQGILDNIMKSRKRSDPTYKYYGKTREEIKEGWDKNRDEAAAAGTKMHYDIECYYNEMEVKNDSIEYEWFQRFVKDFPDLKPYRTEWMVYYEELKLSGSIDMIFENPDGTLQIYDWKRCRAIEYENGFGQSAVNPVISHLPDTNFWHYSLQLNTYKTILELKYGKKITGMYLVCLHPNNCYKTYDRLEVPDLKKEMTDLFAQRKAQVEEMRSNSKNS